MTENGPETPHDFDPQQMATVLSDLEKLKDFAIRSSESLNKSGLSLIVFSGSLDRLLASFVLATGAASMGQPVSMFFTFWGTPALRDPKKSAGASKTIIEKMFGWILPKGHKESKLSQMNMAGLGTTMMRGLMKKKNIASIEEMLQIAGQFGVEIFVCEMSMQLMGFSRDEFVDYPGLDVCGVAKFLDIASTRSITLFI
ncbi:MAG: DsrE/DsrF/DrsH-like family protein [Planctomycetota bacterium]